MKQVFLKFLLVFFVVSQLIIMPVQTAFANDLTDELITNDLGVEPTSEKLLEEQPKQEDIQVSEEVVQEQPAYEQQVEVQEQVRVPQAAAMRAPQQINVTTTTIINEDKKLVNDGDELRVKINWAVPSGVKVQAGDYFYIPVSSNLAMFNGTTINLDGKGSCIVEGTQVKCTLSDFVNDKDNVKGFIGFGAKLHSGLTSGQGKQPTQVTVNGETITLTVDTGNGQTGGPVERVISKFGVRDTENPTKIHWQIALNEKKSNELGRIILNDTIGEGHKLLTDTVTINLIDSYGKPRDLEATADGYFINGIHVTEQSIGADVNLPGATMLISYFTEITDTTKTKWTNDATITANNVNQTENSFVEQYTEGGAQGDLAKYNGEFIVTKVNEAGEALAGATFTFTNGTQTYTLTTDETGKASTGEIPGGIYTLTETTAPAGYTIAEEYATGKEITVNFKDNKTVEQTVENKAIVVPEEPKGAIEIVKKQQAEEVTSQVEEGVTMTLQTADEKTLAGAEFTVTNAAGEVVATLTTGEDGTAKADNLPVGTYTVTETKAPAGYVLDATPYTVEVTANEVAVQTVYNKQEKPQFTCPKFTVTVKGNGTNKDVVRPNITVTAEKEGKQIEFGVTDHNGQATIDRSELEAGIYTFTAKDNDGKVVSTQTITITDEDCATELNLATDKCERFEITILKDKQPVPNKKYVVVKDNVRLELETDENGKMYIPNTVEEGTYTLIDAEDEEQFKEITVSFDGECGTTLELPLVPVIKGCERFEVTVKENGEVVANTTYELHQEGKVITTVTTDDNGKFSVDRDTVTIGDYELMKDGKKVADIKVEYENCEFEVDTTVENTCPKFEITVNENSKAVANATYTATNGESVLTIATDDNGKFVIDRTEVVTGTYVVTQGEKVVGEFTVTEADCEAVVDVTPKYSCEKYEVIVVTEGDNTVRPGLDVTLQGKEELKGTTDKDGKVSFDRENVPAGDYKVIVDGEEIKTITIVDEDCKVTIELPKVEEPTTPVDPEKPTTPVDPEKPVTPVDPEKPVTPVDPEKPTTPVDPEKPVTPVDPEKPVTPVDPEKPVTPVDPEKPVTPVDPEKPTTPVDPEKPTTPVDPEKPVTPVDPEKPVTPVDPEKPVTPVDPEKPVTPVDPELPPIEVPTEKPNPGKPEPEQPVTPVDPEPTPVEPEKPTTPVDPELPPIEVPTEKPNPGKPEPEQPVTPVDPELPPIEVPTEKPNPGKPEPEQPVTPVDPELPSIEVPTENPNTENEKPTIELPTVEKPNTGNELVPPTISVPAKELPKAGNEQPKLPQTDGESTLALTLAGFALIAASIFLFTRRKQVQ